MDKNRKQRFIGLGAEALADALQKLAGQDEAANDLVERMIAAPKENIKRFKAKLSGLKRMRRFIRWGESAGFARELEAILEDLKAGVEDARTGAELVAAFYETDKGTLGNCDDSSGHVGDVFRYDARKLFVSFASRCDDKEWLADIVFKLNMEDDYGVRDSLIDCAVEYLPEPAICTLIDRFQIAAGKETDEYRKRHWLSLVGSLARQIKDALLFEKTRIASWGKLSTAACVDIARVYLESSDALTALSWLERIPEKDTFQADERDKLLLEIHGRLGNLGKQAEVAWRIFRRHRSADSLAELLAVIGEDQKEQVIFSESKLIHKNRTLSYSDAAFLIEMGRMDEAETYLLDRIDQLNGDFYGSLLPLAEAMEADGRPLPATVLYRALLDSILRRAQTKTYQHGVRYLKKLDRLAMSVPDWRDIETHSAYLEMLRQVHGRKLSFWSRYEK